MGSGLGFGLENKERSKEDQRHYGTTKPLMAILDIWNISCTGETGRRGDGEMGRWGDGETGRRGDGEMGRWGDGKMGETGRRGDGEMGRRGDGEMGRRGDGETGRWGDGETGRWGDGETGRWGDGEMGRWGDGEMGRRGDGETGDGDHYISHIHAQYSLIHNSMHPDLHIHIRYIHLSNAQIRKVFTCIFWRAGRVP